jgi:hypothetical protein
MPAKSSAKSKTRKPAIAPASRDRNAPPKAAIKIGKRLEAVAREIKDADEFVEHVAGLANRYRREHALASGDAQAELRQSLRNFQKHASALAEWLQEANSGKASAIERKAFDAVGTKLYGSPVLARPQSVQTMEWLVRAARTADESIAGLKRTGGDNAPLRIAAEGLRATFEHHKLKVALVSGDQPSDAVRLLVAVARDAGDDVEPNLAKITLRDVNRRPEPQVAS